MSIEVLTARLPAALQRACRLLNLFIIAAFLLYVIGMGAWLSWISRARSFQGIPEVSYSWVTMSMPVARRCIRFPAGDDSMGLGRLKLIGPRSYVR